MQGIRIAVLLALLATAGCGSGSQKPAYNLSKVDGTLKINGKPAPDIYVDFFPTGEKTKGNGASGRTDAAGKYTLKDKRGGAGVAPGEYKVLLSASQMADGSDLRRWRRR